jgi:hypothetical protein
MIAHRGAGGAAERTPTQILTRWAEKVEGDQAEVSAPSRLL